MIRKRNQHERPNSSSSGDDHHHHHNNNNNNNNKLVIIAGGGDHDERRNNNKEENGDDEIRRHSIFLFRIKKTFPLHSCLSSSFGKYCFWCSLLVVVIAVSILIWAVWFSVDVHLASSSLLDSSASATTTKNLPGRSSSSTHTAATGGGSHEGGYNQQAVARRPSPTEPALAEEEEVGALHSKTNDININNNKVVMEISGDHDPNNPTALSARRPLCIIHMGPHKTGTTSIQYFLRNHEKDFWKDGYDATMVLGKKNNGGLGTIRNCIKLGMDCSRSNNNTTTGTSETEESNNKHGSWQEALENVVQLGAAQGRNLLISDEEFAHFDFEHNTDWSILRSRLQDHYQVHVILVYRRYFEWLPSYYNQHYKQAGPFRARLNQWPRYAGDEEDPSVAKNEGGVPIPSFAEYWDQRLNNTVVQDPFIAFHQWDDKLERPCHDVGQIRHKMESQNISVTVLDYHVDDNIVTRFVCDGVPNATHVCSVAHQDRPSRKNPSNARHDWHRVACHAKRKGLIPNGIQRLQVVKKVKKYMETLDLEKNPLPTTCLDGDQLSLFRNISYEAEVQIMPSALPTFEESFARAVSSGKFCNVDVESVVHDLPWADIFAGMTVDPSTALERKYI